MGQWTIGKQVVTSFLATAAITLGLGLVGYYGTVKSNEAIYEIGRVRLPSVQSLLVISKSAESIQVAQRTLLNADAEVPVSTRSIEREFDHYF